MTIKECLGEELSTFPVFGLCRDVRALVPIFFIRKKNSFPQDSTSPQCLRTLCGEECSQRTSPRAGVLRLFFVYRMATFVNKHIRTSDKSRLFLVQMGRKRCPPQKPGCSLLTLCVPSASAHPAQHTCRCCRAGVGGGLKEPPPGGSLAGDQVARAQQAVGSVRCPPGLAKGDEAPAPGSSAPQGLSQRRAQLSGQLPGALDVCVCRGGRLSTGRGPRRGPGPTGLS